MLRKIKFLAVLIFSFSLVSCSDSILDNPENITNEQTSLSKGNNFENDNPLTTVTKTINGRNGGVINLTGIYIGLDLKIITIFAKLTIPPGAFTGTRNITLTADWQTPGIICKPAMQFNIPLTLDLRYIGIDLTNLLFNQNNVFFAYLGDDGTIEPCDYEKIDFNLLTGLLGVRKAKINHFSRYGFSR
jgi:hypothetical protein